MEGFTCNAKSINIFNNILPKTCEKYPHKNNGLPFNTTGISYCCKFVNALYLYF